jgi:thiosulfate/3-mercaptopyruvate sulfurtransferase
MSFARLFLACALLVVVVPARAQFAQLAAAPESAMSIPQDHVMQIDELNDMLKDGKASKPLILQVGSHMMFAQAHIPSAQYAGPGSQPEGQHLLHAKVVNLPKDKVIVLYCGCCPWTRCPNVGPAYAHLMQMGFKHVKVLYIASNFGDNWVSRGYAVEKGE